MRDAAKAECQKCMQYGHWTYQCTNRRVYLQRPTRTQILKNPRLNPKQVNADDAPEIPLITDGDWYRDRRLAQKLKEEQREIEKAAKRSSGSSSSSSSSDSDSDSDSDSSSSSSTTSSSSSSTSSSSSSASSSSTSTSSSSSAPPRAARVKSGRHSSSPHTAAAAAAATGPLSDGGAAAAAAAAERQQLLAVKSEPIDPAELQQQQQQQRVKQQQVEKLKVAAKTDPEAFSRKGCRRNSSSDSSSSSSESSSSDSSSDSSSSRDSVKGLRFDACGGKSSNPKPSNPSKPSLLGWASPLELKGSVFMSRRLWRTVSCYWAIAAATALIVVNFEPAASSLRFGALQTLVDGLSTLVGFLLGLFVSTSLSRWWALRQQLTQLSSAVYDLLILACCHLDIQQQPPEQQQLLQQPQQEESSNNTRVAAAAATKLLSPAEASSALSPSAAAATPAAAAAAATPAAAAAAAAEPYWSQSRSLVLRRLLRLGCVSFHLVFDAAQGREDLQYLLREGLLSPLEAAALRSLKEGRALLPWMAAASCGAHLARRSKLLFGPNATRRWTEICSRGSSAVSQCLAYVQTPLPHSYVHLLLVIVLIANTLSAALAGLAAGSSICRLQEVWGGGVSSPGFLVGPDVNPAAAAGAKAAAASGPLVAPVVRPHVWEAVQGICMHLMLLLVLPTFYHGIIDLAQRINNPFGNNSISFPRETYVHQLEAQGSALCVAAAAAAADYTPQKPQPQQQQQQQELWGFNPRLTPQEVLAETTAHYLQQQQQRQQQEEVLLFEPSETEPLLSDPV
ncbi:hypothetical protein Esti_004959 [Eimeria stiedai]